MTAVPVGGADRDVGELLRDIDRRLQTRPHHPTNHQTQMVLTDLHRLLGLARDSLLDPDGARVGRTRWQQHLDWAGQLRIIETDTAVDLALADLRRERDR